MGTQDSIASRPLSPESLSSLYRTSNTIDDLTLALSSFSPDTSQESQTNLNCCCATETCENLQSWYECKVRLESKLTLSAEVGQALLQRHEAYVRRHEVRCQIKPVLDPHLQNISDDGDEDETKVFRQEQSDIRFADLLKEKQALEKRLNQVIVNNEVTEVSNKTLLQELQDSRATISRLTAHHARSIGWDTRITAALKERDDMQQERDSESHRARLAESRFAALKDKTSKLQTEVRQLQDSLEEKRSRRLESSGSLLQDARNTLESLRETHNPNTVDGHDEITRILESLVHVNESLRQDNSELQQLLGDAREEFTSLQEEYEEYKSNPPVALSGANTPNSRHSHRPSIASVVSTRDPNFTKLRRNLEAITPESTQPRSPTDSPFPLLLRRTPSYKVSPLYSPSRYGSELDSVIDDQERPVVAEHRRFHRPLLLLSHSRGVQTEPVDHYPSSVLLPSLIPSLMPSLSSHDQSEASSSSDSSSTQITSLIDRILSLLARMAQADPLTLTNRLKRQHLKGDVGHLSKSTIGSIVSEVNALRQQYRSLLEDSVALSVTRKDLRGLFKFLRDIFIELGQVKITLNEVILDPSAAPRISERALHPERGQDTDQDLFSTSIPQSWIAPISRLFSTPRYELPSSLARSTSSRNTRFVPKSGPDLAASATTVNVEFSGVGGRTTTKITGSPVIRPRPAEGTTALKDIFAGAPQVSTSTSTSTDTWIVVPPLPQTRRIASIMQLESHAAVEYTARGPMQECIRGIGHSTAVPTVTKTEVTRAVDAVTNLQHPVAPLLQRTLRRGLSDSSIHSTFASQPQQQGLPSLDDVQSQVKNPLADVLKFAWSDGSSVFQTLSKTVQNLKLGGTVGASSEPNPALRKADTMPSAIGAPRESIGANVTSGQKRRQTPRLSGSHKQTHSPEASFTFTVDYTTRPKGATSSTSNPALSSRPSASLPKSPNAGKAVHTNPWKARGPDFASWAATGLTLDPAHGLNDPFISIE